MKRRYFIGAVALHGSPDHVADFVDAECFDEALQTLRTEAQRRYGSRPYRLTAVSEQLDQGLSGPISMAIALAEGSDR